MDRSPRVGTGTRGDMWPPSLSGGGWALMGMLALVIHLVGPGQ